MCFEMDVEGGGEAFHINTKQASQVDFSTEPLTYVEIKCSHMCVFGWKLEEDDGEE